jgi:hypothetical protein
MVPEPKVLLFDKNIVYSQIMYCTLMARKQ